MNSITDLLDLEDNDVIISNIDVQGQTKVLTLMGMVFLTMMVGHWTL